MWPHRKELRGNLLSKRKSRTSKNAGANHDNRFVLSSGGSPWPILACWGAGCPKLSCAHFIPDIWGPWIAPCHLFVWTCFREVTAVARHPATPADANSQAIPTSPASPVSPTRPANPASTTGSYAHLLAQGTPPWCVSLLSAWPSECQAYLAATHE